MDGPLQRTLRVGKISIGLFGLDIALNRVAGNDSNDQENQERADEEDGNQLQKSTNEVAKHGVREP